MTVGLTNRSTAVTTGGEAEWLMEHNTGRQYLLVHNLDEETDLWLAFDMVAVPDFPGSVKLEPGASWFSEDQAIPSSRVSVYSTLTGHKVTAYEG